MYKNLGDINFFDTGRLVKRINEDELVFEIITCDYDNDKENNYSLKTGTINLAEMNSDELNDICKWANRPFFSMSGDYGDHERMIYELIVDVFEYQPKLADDLEERQMTKNEIIDFIDHGYIDEIEWDFYEANFYQSNRNCVVSIYDNYSISTTEIYDTLEDALEKFEQVAEKGWSLEVIDK